MTDQTLQESVSAMRTGTNVFDVTIVCTTDDHQAEYWMNLLETGLLTGHKVLAVSEDWTASGGAGNGLGTLYAWKKACALAATKYQGLNLQAELGQGKLSAALYHTAGKGTRMAPLPASENNNKPGVKLPFPLFLADGTVRPVSVLESVIRQTGIYASSRLGRLSVFWGDQVFLPSAPFVYTPTHHVDIMCTLLGDTAPTAEEWKEQGLDKYGVIAVLDNTNDSQQHHHFEAAQVEKVSHETAVSMLGSLGTLKQVGPSLGSFSVSAAILQALCDEFGPELEAKTAKLDTDPHFWMPLTLPKHSYVTLMEQKGVTEAESKAHYERMEKMKTAFQGATANDSPSLGLFGAIDVGRDACWWDYGQLKLYSRNSLLLMEDGPSAQLLRQFLGIESSRHIASATLPGSQVDEVSFLVSSKIGSASVVTKSLLAGVQTPDIHCNGAILVNCVATKIRAGPGSILYNLVDESETGIVAGDGEVIVGVTDEGGKTFVLKSRMDIDGGQAWKTRLEMNDYSFEDVHGQNYNANIGEISRLRQARMASAAQALGL